MTKQRCAIKALSCLVAALAMAGWAARPLSALDLPRFFSHRNLSEQAAAEMRAEEKISEELDQSADYRSRYQSIQNRPIRLQSHVKPGEELVFQAKWRGLPAGTLRLAAKRLTRLKNRPVFVFELQVTSNDFMGAFYPVDNSVISYADANDGHSYLLRRNISERHRRYKDRLEFKYDSRLENGLPDPVSRYSLVDELGREEAGAPFPIPGAMHDMVSSIYCLRGMDLRKIGDSQSFLLGSRQKPVIASVTVVAEEQLNLPGLGKFACLVVEPSANGANLSGHPLATRGGEKVWLEKHCRIPLQVSAELPWPVGQVIASLVNAEKCDLGRYALK
ncbi:MAG: DUF3108 domain-containing protein [Planctomycetota bacterium]|nr:DUF3108 domain-containing protein [Planctomycetota bacterium]